MTTRYTPPGYWTRQRMLDALRAYVIAHGHFPAMGSLGMAIGTPSKEKARQVFGTLKAYYEATGLDAPRWPKRCPDQGEHHEGAPAAREPVTCLACDRVFFSPDKRRIRLCGRCRDAPSRQEGLWLSGAEVREAGDEAAWVAIPMGPVERATGKTKKQG